MITSFCVLGHFPRPPWKSVLLFLLFYFWISVAGRDMRIVWKDLRCKFCFFELFLPRIPMLFCRWRRWCMAADCMLRFLVIWSNCVIKLRVFSVVWIAAVCVVGLLRVKVVLLCVEIGTGCLPIPLHFDYKARALCQFHSTIYNQRKARWILSWERS